MLYLLFLILCVATSQSDYALAQGSTTHQKSIYFDADEIIPDTKKNIITVAGNVLILFGDTFVAADRAQILTEKQIINVEGNVRLVRKNENIFASQAVFDRENNEMELKNVTIIADPQGEDKNFKEKILGFSEAEVAFESARLERNKELQKQLRSLRDKYVNLKNLSRIYNKEKVSTDKKTNDIIKIQKRYAQILERMVRTRSQPNLVFDSLPDNVKQRALARRKSVDNFLKASSADKNQSAVFKKIPGYLQTKAKILIQKSTGEYLLRDVVLTVCRCEDSNKSAWGLSSNSAKIEPQEYVTLQGATVDVFSVPGLYLPWLKFPIKNQRQSGFLLPSAYASSSGTAVSQPFFLNLSEYADATLSVSHFSQRGFRGEVEGRFQVTQEAAVRFYGEGLEDQKYAEDLTDAGLSSKKNKRWLSQVELNAAPFNRSALKLNGEFLSDNRYLSDFGQDSPAVQDLFATKQNVRRFLNQEGSFEYYGNDFVVSLRSHGLQDVFSEKRSQALLRLPRAEFYLLPRHIPYLPVVYNANLQWERVKRLDGDLFLDFNKNLLKDTPEPYIAGDRAVANFKLFFPLPANDYINAFASSKFSVVQYDFPKVQNIEQNSAREHYLNHELQISVPLVAKLDWYSQNTLDGSRYVSANVRHDLTPFFKFSYIPKIVRAENFPFSSQLFYANDNIVHKQSVEIGVESSWTVAKNIFLNNEKHIARIPESHDLGIASEKYLDAALKNLSVSATNTPDRLYNISKDVLVGAKVFDDWARVELDSYDEEVLLADAGQHLIWPDSSSYQHTSLFRVQPVSFKLSTVYDFEAARTALEINSRLQNGETPKLAMPWSEFTMLSRFSLQPVLPLSGEFEGFWNPSWERISKSNFLIVGELPYGFGVNLRQSTLVFQKKDSNGFSYDADKILGASLSYQPFPWLKFQYQKEQKILRSVPRADNPEYEYQATQSIFLLNIQDCLNLTLQRFKSFEVIEKMATWSIGLNLAFLGQKRNLPDMGHKLDQAIKNSL